jgi:DNA-binding transcriptional LysR family regulator
MTSRELEIFHAVMSSRSLTEAAASLRVSQPALSKAVKRLEDRLRVALFRRVKGRLRPTLEAESLFPEAARLVREIGSLSRTAMELRDGETGLLRVAASASLGVSVVPAAMAAFAAAHPKVKLVSHVLGAVGIAEMLVDNHVDIGMTLSPVATPGITTQNLATVPMVCALREKHPLAARRVIRPRDLEGVPLISFGSDTYFGQVLDEAFARDGVERRIAIELIIAIQAPALVLRGAGVALIDGHMQAAGFGGVVWRPFMPEVLLPVNAITSSMRPISRLAQRFLDQVVAVIGDGQVRPGGVPSGPGTGTSSRARA